MSEHIWEESAPADLGKEQELLGIPGALLGKGVLPGNKGTKAEPFHADQKDGIFAVLVFVLGFYFIRWVFFAWQGWGVTLFTLVYCGIVTAYLLKKRVHISKAGWFWLTAVLVTGISFSLFTSKGLEPWRSLFLLFSAVYWVISATNLTILGKTSNWFGLDSVNGLLVIPFKNFTCQYKSLAFLGQNKKNRGKQIFSVALGLLLTLIVVGMVLPLLMEADSGGFSKITSGFLSYFQGMREETLEIIWQGIFAIPVAAYIFGLVSGSVHKRGVNLFNKDNTLKAISAFRVLPMSTIYTLLGLLCSLYIVFIGSQMPYFFSAFVGDRPEGWQVYSEYARNGFFELCRIAAINLFVLALTNVLNKKLDGESKALKLLNSLLAFLTIVLIATALSKMAMYIGAYGLSMRRLLPCLFMIFLAVICGGTIALQKWQISIVRLAVGVGVVMLCSLCILNPDGFVARYNAERYLAGTLNSFDIAILYQSGSAGVDPALKVYEKTKDQILKNDLKSYLLAQQMFAGEFLGEPQNNLEMAQARKKIARFLL